MSPETDLSRGRGAPGWRRAVAPGLTVAMIVASYLWFDQPVAYFVHDHDFRRWAWLAALTHIPDLLVIGSVVVLLAAPFMLARPDGPSRAGRVPLAMAGSLAIAFFLKDQLKIVFGRAWPETWTHSNPSLIRDHVYGFFWWRFDNGFHSFPSGHTTLTFAVVSVLWLALPAWRWLGVGVGVAVAVGLLGMDYHFLSDVLAGALLGSLCGSTVWGLLRE